MGWSHGKFSLQSVSSKDCRRSVIVRQAWRSAALTFTFSGASPGSVNITACLLRLFSGWEIRRDKLNIDQDITLERNYIGG